MIRPRLMPTMPGEQPYSMCPALGEALCTYGAPRFGGSILLDLPIERGLLRPRPKATTRPTDTALEA